LVIHNPEIEDEFHVFTSANVAMTCGETLNSLIEGDSEATQYALNLPSVGCFDLLWIYFRIGELTKSVFFSRQTKLF
jgi:hypothetical protein